MNIGPRNRRLPERFVDSIHFTAQRNVQRDETAGSIMADHHNYRDLDDMGYTETIELLGDGTENRTAFGTDFVNTLPEFAVSVHDLDDGQQKMECPICCIVELRVNDIYKKMACSCIICLDCLTKWIVTHRGSKCPLCRQYVDGSPPDPQN